MQQEREKMQVNSWFLCFNDIWNCVLFNAKAVVVEKQLRYYSTHNKGNKGVYTFPKGISPKVNVIARPDFEFTYYNVTVQNVNAYTTSVIFWPSTRPKNAIPRWYTGRKWHIPMASNRKRSRGRIKAYDMGQGEGPIVPLQWCTGRE